MRVWHYLCVAVVAGCTVHQDLGSNDAGDQNPCSVDQCGQAAVMPSYQCSDGSWGGPTGRCVEAQAGVCRWEMRTCPDAGAPIPEDAAAACVCTGPRPSMPNETCADGTQGGPVCTSKSDGTCSWQVLSCPVPEDAAAACVCTGVHPNVVRACEDGTTVGATCTTHADGTCSWEIPACPLKEVDAGICTCKSPGPMIPSEVCSDGSLGGPVCATKTDGSCGWEVRACPKDAGIGGADAQVACQPSICLNSNECGVGEACVDTHVTGPCVFMQCCLSLACAPACANGVMRDKRGCATCDCAP